MKNFCIVVGTGVLEISVLVIGVLVTGYWLLVFAFSLWTADRGLLTQ